MLAVGALSAQRGIVTAERGGVRERIFTDFAGTVGGMLQKVKIPGARGGADHADRHMGLGRSGSAELQPQLPHDLARLATRGEWWPASTPPCSLPSDLETFSLS